MTARPKHWRRALSALRKGALGLGGMCFSLQSLPLQAQGPAGMPAAVAAERPRVGLVLSGGGALGMSHIGVLEVLEKLRVPVDCVTGASFGAIIGGLYAAGRAPQELEQAVKTIDWDVALGSQARRQDRSYRRKSDDEGYLIPYKLGLENGEIKSPPGLVSNVNLTQLIRALAQRDEPAFDFKDLPIPFWAVAADLKTGDEVILSKGNLVAAIVASMSVPGLFPATEIDGHKLVDGGIANNVPISVAREQCHADKLIVVNLSRPPESYDDLDDFAGVLGQMVNIMTYRNARAQLDTLHEDDILLTPALQDFEFTDFNKAEKIVPRGRAAALAATERLKALSVPPRDWAVYIETLRPKVPLPAPVIAEIKIDNESRLGDEVVRSALGVEPGQRLDRKALGKGISKLHGLDYFDSINYAIENQADGRAVVDISVRERRWARKHFRFGLALEDNFNGESSYRLGMSYTVLGLNRRGGEWRSQLEMGTDQRLASEIYQPIDDRQTYFGAVAVDLSRTSLSLRDPLGLPVSIIGVNAAMAEARLGRVFGNWGALSLTGNYRVYGLERRAGPEPAAGFFSGTRNESNMGLRFDVDTIDKVSFPRHGVQFQAAYMIDPMQTSPFQNGRLVASGFGAWSWGENTLIASSLLATNLSDDESLQDYFSLGGFLSMSGYARNELAGPHVTQAGLIYLRRLNEQSNPILDLPFYLGLTMEAGQVWRNTGDFRLEDLILGGSLVLGADTPLGPVYLAGGRNSDGRSSLFLYLGQIF